MSSFGSGLRLLALLTWILPGVASAVEDPAPVPESDYAIYDRVILDKFLTSRTTLVVIQRLTTTSLGLGLQEPPDKAFFHENDLFGGTLDSDLIVDFVYKSKRSSRLQSRFAFGIPYRFAAGQQLEGPEVSLAPIPAQAVPPPWRHGPPPTVGILEFSRVAFNRQETQALVYVGVSRPDGSGGGFFVRLNRFGKTWESADTELLWISGHEGVMQR